MAQDSAKRTSRLEKARKDVAFDFNDLEEITSSGRESERYVRRRSRAEGKSEEMTIEEPLNILPPEQFEECRYRVTTEELNSAIENGIGDLAARYSSKGKGPAFLLSPLTEEGKRSWPESIGMLDFEEFKVETQENPEAVFQEMKFRSLANYTISTRVPNALILIKRISIINYQYLVERLPNQKKPGQLLVPDLPQHTMRLGCFMEGHIECMDFPLTKVSYKIKRMSGYSYELEVPETWRICQMRMCPGCY